VPPRALRAREIVRLLLEQRGRPFLIAGERGAQSRSVNTPRHFGITTSQIAEKFVASTFL